MKKQIERLLILSVVISTLGLASGCQNSSEPVNSITDIFYPMFSAAGNYDGYIYAVANQPAPNLVYYDMQAAAYKHTGEHDTLVYCGSVTAAGSAFNIDSTTGGYLYQWGTAMGGSNPIFGATSEWGFSGSAGAYQFSDTMRSPALIQINSSAGNDAVASKNGFAVTWNTDASNQSEIGLLIQYHGRLSQRENPSLPGDDFFITKKTSDVGNYVFSANELSRLPVGGIITINIARSKQKDAFSSGKKYLLTSIARASLECMVGP